MESLIEVWVSRLAAPEDAMTDGGLVLAVAAVATYVLLRCVPTRRSLRVATLVGELAVVAGLIGLFSLVGRVYLDFADHQIRDSAASARVAMAARMVRLETACGGANSGAGPTNINAALAIACDTFKSSQVEYAAREDPSLLAAQYAQLSQTQNLDATVANLFKSARLTALALSDSLLKGHMHGYYEDRRRRHANWELVLICALSVACGAGVKCGRALADLVTNWGEA